jgi:penicillin V acylase-like amidase (Ntn superfamily)
LGAWTLGQFATVAEVKAALQDEPVLLVPVLNVFGKTNAPFHYVLHDRAGATIVIEFAGGKQTVYDDPVGVMTNGPELSWHLTNLNNYTYLGNVDRSTNRFGTLNVSQPDAGIAMAGLPASNTSVGRFVRAVYYSQYVRKAANPDDAIVTLAHIMNNFDRPLDATIEYTQFTSLFDLNRGIALFRSSEALNYTRYDLNAFAATAATVLGSADRMRNKYLPP